VIIYGLDDRDSILGRGRDFSFRHRVQTDSGAHPDSCPVDTGNSSPEGQRPRREADISPPSSAEVNSRSYPICLHGVVLA